MHKWKKKVAALRRQRGITKSCLSSQSFRSLARKESRNESIGSDQWSEQPVFRPLPRTPINLNGSMSALA
jgi:hypothetical protein